MAKQKKRADGRYCKNITLGRNDDGSLKRKMVYANTQKELELKVAELLLQVDKGTIIDDKNKTVGKWADEWLEAYTSNFKESTKTNHKRMINKYIKPNFKDIRLKDLKQYQVQKALNDIKAASVPQNFLTTLNKILDSAVENDMIIKNVAKKLSVKRYEVEAKVPLTNEQINVIENTDFILQDICVFLIYTGLRISELINLVWSDINLKKLTIKIHGDVKTAKSNRIIPIFEPTLKILKKFDKNRIKNIDAKSDYVFLINGAKCSISDLSNKRYECCETVGFDFTYHQLRHTFATICYNAKVDIKQAQEWLGHASFNTTMDIYTHLDEQNKKNATSKIKKYLKSI